MTTDPETGFHTPTPEADKDDSIEANAPRFISTEDDMVVTSAGLDDPPLSQPSDH